MTQFNLQAKAKYLVALVLVLASFSSCKTEPKPVTYFIDPLAGDDALKGISLATAWRSFSNLKTVRFNPGDEVVLTGPIEGSLVLSGVNGLPGKPIVIRSTGETAIIIAGEGLGVHLSNSRQVEMRDIEVQGAGRLQGNLTDGILIEDVHDLVVDNVKVSGFLHSGLNLVGGSRARLTKVIAHDNGYCGIKVSGLESSSDPKPFRDLYLGYCKAYNNPGCPARTDNHSGNGILVGGVIGGIVEYCEAWDNGWDMPRKGNGPVGIWAYKSDSLIIQHCYAHHNKTSPEGHDGGGFDFDGGVTNSIMQYNLSAYNEGSGYGMYQYLEAPRWENNIVRFNISYLDGRKNGKAGIHMWAHQDNEHLPIRNLSAYNNTIINDAGHGINFEPGVYENFVFENNIIYLVGKANKFVGGAFEGAVLDNNLYWSESKPDKTAPPFTVIIDANRITENPELNLPLDSVALNIQDIELLKTIEYFRIKDNSPALKAAKTIMNSGGKDFWGNLLQTTGKLNIGAYGKQ